MIDEGTPAPDFTLPDQDGNPVTLSELRVKGVELVGPVSEEAWGRVARLPVPGIGELGLYEPRHPTPPR